MVPVEAGSAGRAGSLVEVPTVRWRSAMALRILYDIRSGVASGPGEGSHVTLGTRERARVVMNRWLIIGAVLRVLAAAASPSPDDESLARVAADSFLANRYGSHCAAELFEFLEVVRRADGTRVVRYCLVRSKPCPSGAVVGIGVDGDWGCSQVEGLPLPDAGDDSRFCCAMVTPVEARRIAREWGFASGTDRSGLGASSHGSRKRRAVAAVVREEKSTERG